MIKQFGPKRADGFDRAIARVMTGSPSQLGRLIVNDICPEVNPLSGCHCADTVLGIWRRSLPSVVRNKISDMDFTADTYRNVFDMADAVWTSNNANTTVVAALTSDTTTPSSLNETQPGLQYPVPEVNAVSRGRGGRGRGRGRGGRGRGGGQQQQQQNAGASVPRHKGTKHPDLPAGDWQGCAMHFKHGRQSFFCSEPATCPWKNVYATRPQK